MTFLPVERLVVRRSLSDEKVGNYVVKWIKNPDSGSSFERKTRFIRWLPGGLLTRAMLLLKYDGLLFKRDGEIVSHVFFQRHGDSLHAFSFAVGEKHRHLGLFKQTVADLINHAKVVGGITRVRLGAGGHDAVAKMHARLRDHEKDLAIRVGKEGWVYLQ